MRRECQVVSGEKKMICCKKGQQDIFLVIASSLGTEVFQTVLILFFFLFNMVRVNQLYQV